MQSLSIDRLEIGQKASFSKTVTETDVYMLAGITGDFNPVHIDKEYAKSTVFQGRIAHGILTEGLLSAVIGVQLPGPGSICVGKTLKFLAPVHIGDTVTASVEVSEIIQGKNRVILRTTCTNQDGIAVLDGELTILPPT